MPPVRKRSHNNLFLRKNLRIGDMKQNTQRERERERGTKNVYIHKQATITNDNQQQQHQQQPLQNVTKSLYIVTHLGQLPSMLITQALQRFCATTMKLLLKKRGKEPMKKMAHQSVTKRGTRGNKGKPKLRHEKRLEKQARSPEDRGNLLRWKLMIP